jgi:hypothetical protein
LDITALSQQAAATLLSVTPRSLRDWEKAGDGIPRNVDGSYPGPALVAWYVARQSGDELDPVKERARKDKEAADQMALKNAETRGDVARVSIMEEEVAALLGDHKTNALGLPSKVAPYLVGLNADQIRVRIEAAVHELLGGLADYRPGNRKRRRAPGAASSAEDSDAAAQTVS